MHRIDGPGATVDKKFTQGNPGGGVAATQVTEAWLNAVQEEIAGVVEGLGLALDKPTNTQLLAAIKGSFTHATNGYQKLASGLIIQWGTGLVAASGASVVVTLPIAFTSAAYAAAVARQPTSGTVPPAADFANIFPTTTNVTITPAATTAPARIFSFLVIGK